MKRCTKCGESKPLSEFTKDKRTKDGYRCWCCACAKVCRKTYNAIHGETIKTYSDTHKKEKANTNLIKKFGITLEDKRDIWKQQDGRCAICGKRLTESRDCCVDHCHITGIIRGMLCKQCNQGIGYLKDDPIILRKAADYLEVGA